MSKLEMPTRKRELFAKVPAAKAPARAKIPRTPPEPSAKVAAEAQAAEDAGGKIKAVPILYKMPAALADRLTRAAKAHRRTRQEEMTAILDKRLPE